MLKLISPFILGERDWLYVDVEACQKTVCQIMTEFSTRRGKKHSALLTFRKQIENTFCFYRVKRNTRESLGEHQKQRKRILFLKEKLLLLSTSSFSNVNYQKLIKAHLHDLSFFLSFFLFPLSHSFAALNRKVFVRQLGENFKQTRSILHFVKTS